jgi:3-phenylpropionate/trans-cinnamate dioxygenase ferredoxin reductase component
MTSLRTTSVPAIPDSRIARDATVFRGDPADREFIAWWLAGDRVLAGMNVNVWDVVDPIHRLIRERVPVADWRLSDRDVPLEQLAPIESA